MIVKIVKKTEKVFVDFVQRMIDALKEEFYYDSYVDWPSFLEDDKEEVGDLVACFDGQQIKAVCYVVHSSDYLKFIPSDLYISPWIEFETFERKYLEEILNFLKEHYQKVCMDWDGAYFKELSEAGFVEGRLDFERGEYILEFCGRPMVYGVSETFIKEAFEEYYGRKEILDIFTVIKTDKELRDEIYENGMSKIPMCRNHNSHLVFLGFHYFSPREFDCMENKYMKHYFFCVYTKEKGVEEPKLVGVMKILKSKERDNFPERHYLSFIDVHYEYRRMGMAKRLYTLLNDWLTEDDILISTNPSPEGRAANLPALRKRIVTKPIMFDNEQEFYEKRSQIKSMG